MIIGITGTDGSGKGTVVEYLVAKKGFTHYSSREFIMEHLTAAELEPTRNNMRITANKLRAKYGNDFVVSQAFKKAAKDGVTNVVIESVRALAEANFLKANGGILLAVDADQVVRFTRVQGRRSESDKVTFEEFQAHEELEKNDPDPNGMQKAKVMEMADHTITNNGTFSELQHQVDTWLASLGMDVV
jgi:dephospho-CoA kinase